MNKNDIEATKTNGQAQAYRQTLDQPLIDSIRPQSIATFELLPPRVDVRLDYENLHLALWNKKDGRQPEVKALVPVIKRIVKELGILVRIIAYADWQALAYQYPRRLRQDWQRELAELGVETRYLVNINGKNTVDMRIANDVRDLLERNVNAPDAADVIVLGSNDRDFRPVLETARQRRRRVVLLAVKGQLSKHLLDVVDANDIYYIGRDLQLYHNQTLHPEQNGKLKSASSDSTKNGTTNSR